MTCDENNPRHQNMKKRFLYRTAFIAGILTTCCGGGFAVMYVLEAIVKRAGDPDQSLLFWYLPILFLGIIGIMGGIGLTLFGAMGLKQSDHGSKER